MKTLEQQIETAKAHAMTARIEIDTTNSLPDGSKTVVTSEQCASTTYTVTRNEQGCLVCTCPSRVVCKHTALVMLALGIEYQVAVADPMAEAKAARLEAFRLVDAMLALVPTAPVAAYNVLDEAAKVAALAEASAEAQTLVTMPRALTGASESQEAKLLRLIAEQERKERPEDHPQKFYFDDDSGLLLAC